MLGVPLSEGVELVKHEALECRLVEGDVEDEATAVDVDGVWAAASSEFGFGRLARLR